MVVEGPKKRKPLRPDSHQHSPPGNDDVTAFTDESSDEELETFYREGSVYHSQETDDNERISEEERSATPVARETMPRRRKPSLPPSPASIHTDRRISVDRETGAANNDNLYIALAVIIGLLIVVVASLPWLNTFFRLFSSSNVSYARKKASCDHFQTLEERFPTLDETLWDTLYASVRRATADAAVREPGTVLFLHYGRTSILEGFMSSVTNITAGCFGGTEPITLDGKYFKRSDIQTDYGVFLAEQRHSLLQHGVLVVRNIEDVPARAAQAFHTICDTQEPLVERLVIYLTLDMVKAANVYEPSKQSATAEAESLLHSLWKDSLEPAVLQPLITRLTESVYRIV
uniref:Uncharacterized protein n=2 Tax=Anopheles stephensi TaxID=30069 RepID=A0A182Y309_ANOST